MLEEYMKGALLLSDKHEQYEKLKDSIRGLQSYRGRMILLGNGGSFQGHIAHDFLKVGKIATLTPESPSLLTCLANDYPKEDIYAEWLKVMYSQNDILVVVSSSGESLNLVNAIKLFKDKTRNFVCTITGFSPENTISKMGNVNIHLNTRSYGIHECYSQILLHSILDDIVKENQ